MKQSDYKISRFVACFMAVIGFCFGQNIVVDSVPTTRTEGFRKTISIEGFGGKYFTFEHEMEYSGIRLPFSMWREGGKITYQTTPNLALSLIGSHSYTRNLGYMMYTILDIFSPPEVKFSVSNVSFVISYTKAGYFIGTGIDFSYVKVKSKGLFGLTYRDTTLTAVSLRPSVAGGLKLRLFSPLYLAMRVECDLYRFINIGSEGIHLGNILPSANIGLGYTFSLGRSKTRKEL